MKHFVGLAFIAFLLCRFLTAPAFAQSAGSACNTAGNALFPTYQMAGPAAYICNGTTLIPLEGFTSAGNVGIGTTNPYTALEVNGTLKIGNGAETCGTNYAGGIRYVGGVVQFCNGSNWLSILQAAACSVTTPTTFSFTNQTGAAASTLITSNIVQLTGMNCAVTTSISGTGSPAYQICSDAACATVVQGWTTANSSVVTGQYVQLRLTTSASGSYQSNASFIAGGGSAQWTVTTAASCTGSPAAGTVCADGSIYAGISPDTSVPMYTRRCDEGQTWSGSNCSGTRTTIAWNNGGSTYTTTGYTSATTGKANTAGLVALNDGGAAYQAANLCKNETDDGHTDWYLPAQGELNVVYGGKTAIGNFDTSDGGTQVGGAYPGLYWTSTESNNNGAWYQRFSDGGQYIGNKSFLLAVRCVRR